MVLTWYYNHKKNTILNIFLPTVPNNEIHQTFELYDERGSVTFL